MEILGFRIKTNYYTMKKTYSKSLRVQLQRRIMSFSSRLLFNI